MTPARLELRSRGALRRLLVFAEYIDSPSTRLDSGHQHGPTDAQRQAMMVRHRQECVRNPLQIRGDGASETRTRDLLGAIQALSQLSYSPVRPRYSSGRDLQV